MDDEWHTYSPSGKRIAYAPIEGAGGIYSVKAGGGDKTLVAHDGGVPSYSPDGERIANMGADGEIYTMGARGGGKSQLTNNDAYPQKLSWGSRL